jgi:hypothetical protein
MGLRDMKSAAGELGIGERTLRTHAREGSIAVVKIGRRTLFSDRALADFVRRHERPARSDPGSNAVA